jgi:hypothetical protein
MKKHKTHILALDGDDPEKELDFEVKFQMSLTVQQRFTMMLERSEELAERMIRDGRRRPVAVIKRS